MLVNIKLLLMCRFIIGLGKFLISVFIVNEKLIVVFF